MDKISVVEAIKILEKIRDNGYGEYPLKCIRGEEYVKDISVIIAYRENYVDISDYEY